MQGLVTVSLLLGDLVRISNNSDGSQSDGTRSDGSQSDGSQSRTVVMVGRF